MNGVKPTASMIISLSDSKQCPRTQTSVMIITNPWATTTLYEFRILYIVVPTFIKHYQLHQWINTLGPRQDGWHMADGILKWIFLNENVSILLKISLKLVPKVRINNIPALDQIMAWRPPGDKPLSEPMMVWLLTHICITRPQWVNTLRPRQDGWHMADDIFRCSFWMKIWDFDSNFSEVYSRW